MNYKSFIAVMVVVMGTFSALADENRGLTGLITGIMKVARDQNVVDEMSTKLVEILNEARRDPTAQLNLRSSLVRTESKLRSYELNALISQIQRNPDVRRILEEGNTDRYPHFSEPMFIDDKYTYQVLSERKADKLSSNEEYIDELRDKLFLVGGYFHSQGRTLAIQKNGDDSYRFVEISDADFGKPVLVSAISADFSASEITKIAAEMKAALKDSSYKQTGWKPGWTATNMAFERYLNQGSSGKASTVAIAAVSVAIDLLTFWFQPVIWGASKLNQKWQKYRLAKKLDKNLKNLDKELRADEKFPTTKLSSDAFTSLKFSLANTRSRDFSAPNKCVEHFR